MFVGDTHEDLLAEFKSQGVDNDGYVTKYLDPDPGDSNTVIISYIDSEKRSVCFRANRNSTLPNFKSR